jgi:hypothetical protein
MSTMTNITVFDGAASPASHTLVPLSCTREGKAIVARWREQIVSLPSDAQVTCTMKLETLKGGVVRAEIATAVPVMENISGQNAAGYTASPKVAFVDRDHWIKFQHPRSTITSRRLSRMLLTNISNNVSTTVAAATSGFASELLDSQVAPS